MESLQTKLESKVDDIKRKDDFIKNTIIGKVGKQESESDVQYLAKEL